MVNDKLVAALKHEHKNWLLLFTDAKKLGMVELAVVYGHAGIDCGTRMLAAQRGDDPEVFRW